MSSLTCAGCRCHAQGPRPPYRGTGGKRTAGPRRNACGAVVPPGASPGVSLVSFWTLRKKPAPQGGISVSILRLGRGKEAPSSVTACAVPPSPQGVEGFGVGMRHAPGDLSQKGKGFAGGWKPPLRDSLWPLRRGALCAPAGFVPADPILPIQARHRRGVCAPIGPTSGGSTNGGSRCRPPLAPDAGAMPKARVPRIGGPGESGLRDPGGTDVELWSRRERHPAVLSPLSHR